LETAVALPSKYAMHFTELDELYATTGASPEKRLALLEQNSAVVAKRDDALSHEIGLKVFAGKHDEAIQLMTGRRFSVWEGGRLDVADHWVNAHLLRGQQKLAARQFAAALADFQAAKTIPDNLPSDRGPGGGHGIECAYWIGMAREGMGDMDKARQSWHEVVSASADAGRFGGRGQNRGVQNYYQALALRKLGQNDRAEPMLRELITTGNATLAKSGDSTDSATPASARQSPRSRAADAHYLIGLGYAGLGEKDKGRKEFTLALQSSPDHLGAKTALGLR
jgi:tetratricopeptide (TPR) repeat protein